MRRINSFSVRGAALLLVAILGLHPTACSGKRGSKGPPGDVGTPAPTPTVLQKTEDLPGLVVEITGVSGGSRSGGTFQAGDRISVTFTVKKNNGDGLPIGELDYGGILVSGPSTNYQRVIELQSNLTTVSSRNPDGSYTYTFATAIPSTYLAPYNDSASFGSGDGELQGQALLAGTYTVGLEAYKNYTVGVESLRDVGNATQDFLFGGATALVAREVAKGDNCNRCHVSLQAHGTIRRDAKLCLLCHTSGAEDRNVASVAGGTPGVSIDSRVMFHKIHAGAHLPSVLGVAAKPDGTRNYSAPATPYEIVGFQNRIHDYSEVGFPVMPSAYVAYLYDQAGTTYQGAAGNGPMPKDTGFSSLTAAQKLLEDRIRTGVVVCEKCHGDPDGAGPLTAPADGSLWKTQPTRSACGSCHDDIDWTKPYTANGQTMPAQLNDSACTLCHPASGKSLAVEDAHRHPYNNPAFNAGVNLTVTSVEGGTGAGGNHQAGDPIQATFTVKDDAGVDLQINSLTRFQMILVGPTSNTQWVLGNINAFDFAFRKSTPFTGNGTIDTPTVGGGSAGEILAIVFTGDNTFSVIGSVSGSLAAGLTVPDGGGNTGNLTYGGVTFKITDGSTNFAADDRFYFEVVPLASSYTMHVPVDITFELVGDATSGADVFTVGNTPLYWGRQTVFERTALNPGTVLTAGAAVLGRYVAADKAALDAAGIAVGDRVVLNTGEANGEYLTIGRIQTTDDVTGDDLGTADRVWFTTALRYAHSTGAAIQEVTLTARREGVDYNVSNADAGELTLIASRFAAGNPVVVSYRTNGLFGFYRSPGDTLQAVYSAPAADSDDIDATWGDWKGLPLISGTYTVGMWANRDFTLTPLQILTATEGWNNFTSENTTYRIISPPATKGFLFGSATAVESRSMISSGDNCNRCHDDIVFHGFGRRGLETCLLCHSIPGVEDGPKYTFNSWYVGATPGATMDFRMLLHKAHMGKELSKADEYEAIGVFLGTPYPFQAMEIGFPAQPGGAKDCSTCHGTSDAWKEPAARDHESQETPTQVWYTSCNSCHDSDTAVAHANLETDENGVEACAVCHGPGAEFNVEMMHKVR